MLKDLVRALSLANLCFIIAWNDVLNSPIRRFNASLAIVINVMWLSVLFWIAITLARRLDNRLFLSIARFTFPLIVLLTLNGILEIFLPHFNMYSSLTVLGLAAVTVGLFEIAPWHRYIIRAADTFVLVLFPFFLIAISQSSWHLINHPVKPQVPVFNTGSQSGKRVLWLLFDEMDQQVAFSDRPATLRLPELDRLRSQALYATNAYSPSDSTPVSMPAFITGKLLSNTKLVNESKLIITFADSEKSVDWGTQPNLFSKAREAGFNTTLIGWYLPYCSLIGWSLTNCSWMDTESASLAECVSKQIQDLACTVPIASKFVVANGIEAKKRRERKKFAESYIGTLNEAEKAICDPNFGFVLVHWPVPHPPGIYDRRKEEFEIEGKGSYVDNLQLVDRALGALRRKMEDSGTWDDTNVLLTSDHWWRTGIWRPTDTWSDEDSTTLKDDRDHRVPFLLKLAGQKNQVQYDPVFNNILLHDLILALLNSQLSSANNVVEWLNQNRSIGDSPYRFEVPN